MRNQTLDERSWSRECSRRAAQCGVGFRFDPEAPTAYTDGREVVCPTPPANATAEDFAVLRGQVIHECGHVVRKDIFEILREYDVKGGSPIWALTNIIEDEAQERDVGRRFPGDEQAMRDLWVILMQRTINKARAMDPIAPEALDTTVRLTAAAQAARLAAGDWQGRAAGLVPELLELVEPKMPGVTALLGELESEGWIQRIRDCDTVRDSWDCARALHKRLFPNEPEPTKAKGKGKGKPKPGEGQPEEGEGSAAESRPDKGLTDEEKAAAAEIPWQVILSSDHGQERLNGEQAPSRIDWTGKPRTGSFKWFNDETEKKPSGPTNSWVIPIITHPDPALISDVRRRLQTMARRSWQPEQLSGRFDPRNAKRLIMPQVGDGTYNRSVFKTRSERRELDTAVTVLIDCSGSMSGMKYACAAQSAMALYDLFNRALRLPTEVLGFTTYSAPVYWKFKEFSERRVDRDALAARLAACEVDRAMSGNADGDALLWAWDRIKLQRSRRKVIVALSDGSPSCTALGGDPDAALRAAIAAIRKAKGGEVYGIGIQDTNVRRYYSPEAPVINHPGEVTKALVHTLRDILQREAL